MTAFEFYTQEKQLQEQNLKAANKQLQLSSMLRLLIFLILACGVYYFFSTWKIVLLLIFIGIAIFLFLVSRHSNLKYKRDKVLELVKLNELELKILDRDFKSQPSGLEYMDPLHAYSQDIDLFGKGSFFQYMNRSSLKEGEARLAAMLTENSIDKISKKQDAVKELSEKVKWRQEFSAVAKLVKTDTSSTSVIRWFKNYESFTPKFIPVLGWLVISISFLLIAAYYANYLNGWIVFGWFLAGWGFTGLYVKKINPLATNVGKVQETFHQYHQLLGMIEKTTFKSEKLKALQKKIIIQDKKASLILKDFSKAISAMDQRNNAIFIALGNGFLLWDLRQAYRLEKWIKAHSQSVEGWFKVIEVIDAFNSLGNFSFNHADYVFPQINKGEHVIKAKNTAHPLLDPKKRVTNDFEIDNEQFFIITGANMAGKSTFLRTVSLQIVMANIGLPVCASYCAYSPIKLITSMRTTDSLTDDESYFFSELKRLQFIVNAIKTDTYFIILDEILKGTNSTDKAIGSKKFIQKLVKSRSTGIIATHDLSLCEVSQELSQVKNHYFDAEIINDQLYFDYKFKNGICQNMNASFLLKKMEIVD
ncbi:DNA mismatch repair protein MutS [Gillisia sp. M10.2A]|uniref:DNA mismatch repair protein MutS n=1 Tax=Gillisia lutea TaxID=2909668 RepID=A0ABS9ED43_9FLAO|nr:DNA mismatch repair protein MutS [Gillisia lutea]MCF4100804.1 DNA mismatch repair protein MutS [Gillisia lutea]